MLGFSVTDSTSVVSDLYIIDHLKFALGNNHDTNL